MTAKKIKFPKITDSDQIFVELKQKSNGDAYDRTGAVFFIPQDKSLSFFDGLEKGIKTLPYYENGNGKLPRIIFEECGFNIDIIGMQRVKSSASRWRTAFKNGGAIKLTDTRKYNTGRPIEKDLSIEEKYKKLEAKMKLLQAENELLKKLDMIERRVLKKK